MEGYFKSNKRVNNDWKTGDLVLYSPSYSFNTPIPTKNAANNSAQKTNPIEKNQVTKKGWPDATIAKL